MSGARQHGFTIIELTLFIGITGLLLMIALAGSTNTIRNMRFTDSARSFTSFMQQQYDLIKNGVNTRRSDISCSGGVITNSNQQAGTSNCLAMGRLVVFQADSSEVVVYPIVGSEPLNADYSLSDETLIKAFQPAPVTSSTETYDIPWQARLTGFERTDGKATNAIALIRSPRSSRVVQYSFKTSEIAIASLQTVVNTPATNMNKNISMCIKSQDMTGTAPALLTIGDAPNQSAVSIAFDKTDGDCNGV